MAHDRGRRGRVTAWQGGGQPIRLIEARNLSGQRSKVLGPVGQAGQGGTLVGKCLLVDDGRTDDTTQREKPGG